MQPEKTQNPSSNNKYRLKKRRHLKNNKYSEKRIKSRTPKRSSKELKGRINIKSDSCKKGYDK